MPHIIYGGVKYSQVRHAIMCRRCRETIESKYTYDYKLCSCGAVGIDGGITRGNRILDDLASLEQHSMYVATVKGKRIWLPQEALN